LGLNPDQIYNAHDNGLLWRVQPNKQFLWRYGSRKEDKQGESHVHDTC
jgi:hypothetical protein